MYPPESVLEQRQGTVKLEQQGFTTGGHMQKLIRLSLGHNSFICNTWCVFHALKEWLKWFNYWFCSRDYLIREWKAYCGEQEQEHGLHQWWE